MRYRGIVLSSVMLVLPAYKPPLGRFSLLTRWQTVTNGLFMWLGIRGIRNCMKEDHPSIFLISYIGYMVVGLGSILFHATLKCMHLPLLTLRGEAS
jgi:hypothetical protein